MFFSKLFRRIAALLFVLLTGIFTLIATLYGSLPDSFSVQEGQLLTVQKILPIGVAYAPEGVAASKPFSGRLAGEYYSVDLKLLGFIPIKSAKVSVVGKSYVVPLGTPFGIKIFTDGVLVVGITGVDTQNGTENPAKKAGIKLGDVIVQIDGKNVTVNEDIAAAIEKSNGKAVKVTLRRKNMTFTVELQPVKSQIDHKYKAGMWVRDSSAGIGTLAFYCPGTGIVTGLGHAICDVDTGDVLPLSSGDLVGAQITGVTKGQSGIPGELRGRFVETVYYGALLANGDTGVYGRLKDTPQNQDAVEVAMKQQVKQGSAQILATVDENGPAWYDCVIEKVHFNDESPTQNMVIHMTDPTLLEKTGGIVQGMSGSPVLQNGLLVGAVTHVFVNDSTRGYGIFAENMLATAKGLGEEVLQKAG
ncbi:MAG: SpoIVB peptidase [Oscillospiraceae bacterium]|nr:SpoIVB peptidase [Oscillospiraceae bacterium]